MAPAGALAIGLMLGGPAAAQDSGRASDRALAPLVACRPIADPRVRAGCYDAALDRLQQSVAARQVVIMDREQTVRDRRQAFGFGGEHLPVARPAKPTREVKAARAATAPPPVEQVTEIDSTVVSAQQYGYDTWTIRIATNAVWRTTENGISFAPKPGTRIHIHRSLMGGYLMRVGGGRGVRCIRVG